MKVNKDGTTNKKCIKGRMEYYDYLNDTDSNLRVHQDTKVLIKDFIIDKFQSIITGLPKELVNIENDFYQMVLKNELLYSEISLFDVKESVNPYLEYVFKFDTFSKSKSSTTWNPQKFIKLTNLTVCPYCNSQYTFTLSRESNDETKGFSMRPHLDHFFVKSAHPLLALSIYNLIPSCSICNSNIKGNNDGILEENIHPYIEDVDDLSVFKRTFDKGRNDIDYYKQIVGLDTNYKISLIERNTRNYNQVKGFERMFKINERYVFFKDVLNAEIQKAIIYSLAYREGLLESYSHLFKDPSTIMKDLITEDINNNLLSKLKNDVLISELKNDSDENEVIKNIIDQSLGN